MAEDEIEELSEWECNGHCSFEQEPIANGNWADVLIWRDWSGE